MADEELITAALQATVKDAVTEVRKLDERIKADEMAVTALQDQIAASKEVAA